MIWNFDPVAFSILGLDVRWYGITYVVGFFLALYLGWYLAKKTGLKLDKAAFENLIFGLFFAGVAGGRLGEFLFYAPETLLRDPLEVFKIWRGGMSIHGGLIGAVIFGAIWTKQKRISLLRISDTLMIVLAIALGLGRIANFINGELVGVPTNADWGVIFPHVDNILRHPSQLYEAAKNFLLAGILTFFFLKNYWQKPGFLTTIFLAGYGVLRFGIEFFREPDGIIGPISTGQALSLAMIILAFFLAKSQNFWHTSPIKFPHPKK